MQKGSVGALRGITPRLAGAGWAAAFSGFVTCIVYNILLGVSLHYMFNTGSLPWDKKNYERPLSCDSAMTNQVPSTELYLYMNVTAVLGDKDCQRFEYGVDPNKFAGSLYGMVLIAWILCFLFVCRGVKSIQAGAALTATIPFVLVFVLMALYLKINNDLEGSGLGFYFGTERFPYPELPDGTKVFQDPSLERDSLVQDAILQVFFSVGVCYGIMFAYGSYNNTKKPVIMDAIVIALLDFIFAILAGFITFSALGAMEKL